MQHIIPFKGRLHSGTYDLNLLAQHDKVFIMDNHLAASWCWSKKINLKSQYNLFHIDRHYDLLNSQIDYWIEELEKNKFDFRKIKIDDLIKIKYNRKEMSSGDGFQVFRWDNYITIFDRFYPDLLNNIYFATHDDGSMIYSWEIYRAPSYDLPNNLSYWIKESEDQFIVNLDLDYFFCNYNDSKLQFLSDEYVKVISNSLMNAWSNIAVLTIALSPECCGGWENSERILKLVLENLNIEWPSL